MGWFGKRWQWVPLQLDRVQQVKGEFYYQPAISRFVRQYGSEVRATLTHEPGNPHDPNAVRVDLVGGQDVVKCGYLPAEIAPAWVPVVTEAARNRHRLFVEARIDSSGEVWLGPRPWWQR